MSFWCKIGIHDYEKMLANSKVGDFIDNYFKSLGFKYEARYFSYWSKKVEFGTLEINTDLLDSIKYNNIDKVCLRCSKVKSNYNFDDIKSCIDSTIASELVSLKREYEARQILKKVDNTPKVDYDVIFK